MEFLILGALEVRDDQGRPLALGGPKVRALLAVLLLHANQPLAAEQLIDQLWEEPTDSARHGLHLLVHRLRRVLAAHGAQDRLRTRGATYELRVHPGELDSDRLEHLLAEAAEEAAAGRPAGALERYDAALALWRGQPLGELASSGFAQPAAARLQELHVMAATGRAEAMLALGRHAEVVPVLGELSRRHPTQEHLHRLLLLALYRSGRQADALAAYQVARQALVEQYGIEPSEGLQQLQRAILAQDPSLLGPRTAPVPAPAPERELAHEPEPEAAPASAPTASRLSALRTGTSDTAAGPFAEPADSYAAGGRTEARPAAAVTPSTTATETPPERRVVTVLAVSPRTPQPADADPEDLWTHHDR